MRRRSLDVARDRDRVHRPGPPSRLPQAGRAVPRRGPAGQLARLPLHALRRGPRRCRARRHQRHPPRRGAGPRHHPHRLPGRPHRRRPRRPARRPRPRRHAGAPRRGAVRRSVARLARDADAGGPLRPDLHLRFHRVTEGGAHDPRPRRPGRHPFRLGRCRRRPLQRHAAVPRQRTQRDRPARPRRWRHHRAAPEVLRLAVHARRAPLRRHVLQHGRSGPVLRARHPAHRPTTATTA